MPASDAECRRFKSCQGHFALYTSHMTGRGAWSVAGLGGTKAYKNADKAGPYYFLGTGEPPVGRERDASEFAVWRAVMAYQRALNRRLGDVLTIDGIFGASTSTTVTKFQEAHSAKTGTPWGGIGPDTSEALLRPDAKSVVKSRGTAVTRAMVTGTVRSESLWDAGAVGYLDETDLGLAQINGPSHPDLSDKDRLKPVVAFNFIIDYYENALAQLDGNIRDAVASYNLGIGGARSWIKAGRPDDWTPTGETRPRHVKDYIDRILAG